MSDIKSDVAELLTEAGIPFQRDVTPLRPASQFREGLKEAVMAEVAAGLPIQPTLSDTLFPPVRRADTPMVKLTLSGTIELTQEQYQAHLDGARLGPGAVVEVRAVGYVVQPGAAWVKRTEGSGEDREVHFEREGRVKIKLVDIGGLIPTGEEWSEA